MNIHKDIMTGQDFASDWTTLLKVIINFSRSVSQAFKNKDLKVFQV